MKIVKTLRVIEEIPISKKDEELLIQKAKERAMVDKDFALDRWHEQLEQIYSEMYGNFYEEDVESWYIDA